MLKFNVEALIYYTCMFAGDEEKRIIEKAKELKKLDLENKGFNYNNKYYLSEALKTLYFETDSDIELYKNSTESDFSTEEIEFNAFTDENDDEYTSEIIDDLF